MAERQEAHRQHLERTVIEGDVRRADRGLWCGTAVVLVAILAGSGLVYAGENVSGLGIIFTGLGTLAGVFIYGTKNRARSIERRAKILSGQDPDR